MIYTLLCVAALCGIISLAYGDHVVQDVRYAYDTDRLNVWFDTTDYEFKDLTFNVDCDGTAHAIEAGATFAEAVGFGNCAAGNFWFDWKDADGATSEPCISDCASKHPSADTYSTKPISFSTPNTFALDMKKGYLEWSNNTGAPPYAMYRNGTLIVTLKTDLDNSTHYVAYDTDDKPTGGEVKMNGTGYIQWKDPDMTYHHWYHRGIGTKYAVVV